MDNSPQKPSYVHECLVFHFPFIDPLLVHLSVSPTGVPRFEHRDIQKSDTFISSKCLGTTTSTFMEIAVAFKLVTEMRKTTAHDCSQWCEDLLRKIAFVSAEEADKAQNKYVPVYRVTLSSSSPKALEEQSMRSF